MKKILLVDDDSSIRGMYRGLLKSEGYEVHEAASAEAATEFLLHNKVQLILLDINMPEINGGAVMKEVIDEYGRDSKVIVASVYPIERQKRLILEADDYYDKAQSAELLLTKIHILIGGAQLAHGP